MLLFVALFLMIASPAAGMQATPNAAELPHPIEGSWLVADTTVTQDAPVVLAFADSGEAVLLDAQGQAYIGSWTSTGPDAASATFLVPETALHIQLTVRVHGDGLEGEYEALLSVSDAATPYATPDIVQADQPRSLTAQRIIASS
jgi:hypothetical protein